MKIVKSAPIIPACIISSVINILYIVNIISEDVFRLGFLIVILSTLIMNLRIGVNRQKGITISNVIFDRKNAEYKPWRFYFTLFTLATWLITYFIALF